MMSRIHQRYSIVVEAGRTDRYFNEMFSKLMEGSPIEKVERVKENIKTLVKTFDRQDRIMWALHKYRDALKAESGKVDPDYKSERAALNAIEERKELSNNLAEFGHFINNAKINNYKAIINFKFTQGANVYDLLRTLRSMEREEEQKRSTSRLLHNPGHKTLLKFPDGWEWQIIPEGACSKEGAAMRHCGNVQSHRAGDEILSLREPMKIKKHQYWKPHATFIWNDGMLGEMKGIANEKPDPKTYPYIVKLLKDDKIEGINGGGYAAQKNFRLSDLPKADFEELKKLKPSLLSLLDEYKLNGLTPRLRKWLKEAGVLRIDENENKVGGKVVRRDWAVIATFKSPQDFAMEHNSDLLSSLESMDEPVDVPISWIDNDEETHEKIEVLEEYGRKFPEKFKKWQKVFEKNEEMEDYFKSLEENDEEPSDDFMENVEGGLRAGHFSELESTLDTAIRWGWDRGTETNKVKTIKDYLFDYAFKYHEYFYLNIVDKVGWLDSVVEIWAPVEDCLQANEDGDFEERGGILIDFFSGDLDGKKFTGEYDSEYDIDGAMEYLSEEL